MVTTGLIAALWSSGHRVLLPRVVDDGLELADANAGLAAGYRGIPEPTGPAVDPMAVDVILVPGVGFSRDGRRLGQGGGYYDRLLTQVAALKVGVAFSCQISEQIPVQAHDQAMDVIVTEHGPGWCC